MSLRLCYVTEITFTQGTLENVNGLNYYTKQGVSDIEYQLNL